MIVIHESNKKTPIAIASEMAGPFLLYGKDATSIRNYFKTGKMDGPYEVIVEGLKMEEHPNCYLHAEDLPSSKAIIHDRLGQENAFVFLDASDIAKEELADFIEAIQEEFPEGEILIYSPSFAKGELCLRQGDESEFIGHARGNYESEFVPFVYDVMQVHEENGRLVRNKKPRPERKPRTPKIAKVQEPDVSEEPQSSEPTEPKPRKTRVKKARAEAPIESPEEPIELKPIFGEGQAKNLWSNLGFTVFFVALCFLLPIVTLNKEDTEENLKIISLVLGALFVLFACYPTISNINYMRKKERYNVPSVAIAISIHSGIGLILATILACIIKLNGWEEIAYVYVGYLAIAPAIVPIYDLVLKLLKKEQSKK